MKIAHVVDCMEVGGAETLVSQLCQLQREQGHAPRIYAVGAIGELGERMRDEGFSVQANLSRRLPDGWRVFYHIFNESHPDVVHLHNATPTSYAAMPARLAGVPSIVSTRHGLVARPRRLVREIKYAAAAEFCDWLVGVCDATVNNLKEVHPRQARRTVRVYNGTIQLKRIAAERRPPIDGFTLIYVGRLAPVKNLGLLLLAFCNALSSRPDLRLWMVGDGSERRALESLATELGIAAVVKFWGWQLDVAPLCSAADAFILSSKSEGLPISLLQAFSLGLPAIVTNVGGMAEVVLLTKAGLIVSEHDASEMTAAILRLAANDAEREQFSVNAQGAFHSRFTLTAMADAYMDLYRNTPRAEQSTLPFRVYPPG
jgi:glycosyltransferase involved in cell wall biosynthesis